jgi:DNA-binding NtrC family response regulator
VILIQVPPLNNRLEDIPLLARHFINDICESQGIQPIKITESAIAELKKIRWTGNIRELRNVIERLVILCDKQIDAPDILLYAKPLKP